VLARSSREISNGQTRSDRMFLSFFGAHRDELLVASNRYHSTSISTRTNIQQLNDQVVKFGDERMRLMQMLMQPLLVDLFIHFNVYVARNR
jgi:hypothetical protein